MKSATVKACFPYHSSSPSQDTDVFCELNLAKYCLQSAGHSCRRAPLSSSRCCCSVALDTSLITLK